MLGKADPRTIERSKQSAADLLAQATGFVETTIDVVYETDGSTGERRVVERAAILKFRFLVEPAQ